MSTEANKAISRRYTLEPWNQGKLETFDELCAPGFVLHTAAGNSGAQDLKDAVAAFRRALPDLQTTIDEIIAEGDKVAYHWTMRGTHRGEYEGLAATGKPVTFTGITILRIVDGKVVHDQFESSSPDLKAQVSK